MSLNSNQKGFSLIELLLVVVIVGMLATIAIPSLIKSKEAVEKSAVISELRLMHIYQTGFMFQRGRFGTLDEINSISNNTLGTTQNGILLRGDYTYYLFPSSEEALATRYIIIAVKWQANRPISGFLMNQDGVVETLIF